MRVHGKSAPNQAADRAGLRVSGMPAPVAGRLERLQRHRENIRRIYRELNADRPGGGSESLAEKTAPTAATATASVSSPGSSLGQKNQDPTSGRASPPASPTPGGTGATGSSATPAAKSATEAHFQKYDEEPEAGAEESVRQSSRWRPQSAEPSKASDPALGQEIFEALEHYQPPPRGVPAREEGTTSVADFSADLPPAELEHPGATTSLASCSPASEQRSRTISALTEATQLADTGPLQLSGPLEEVVPDSGGTLVTDSLPTDQKLDAIFSEWRQKYAAFQRATQKVLGADSPRRAPNPRSSGASHEAESDDEAFLRRIKQEVGLDAGPLGEVLEPGSASGSLVAEEDFQRLAGLLAAEPDTLQEDAGIHAGDSDEEVEDMDMPQAATPSFQIRDDCDDAARTTTDVVPAAAPEPEDQMLSRLLALEAEVSRLRQGAPPPSERLSLSPGASADSPRRPDERSAEHGEGQALLNSLAMSLLSGSSLFASLSDGQTSPPWLRSSGAAALPQVGAETPTQPVRVEADSRPQAEEKQEAVDQSSAAATVDSAVQVPEAVAAGVQTDAQIDDIGAPASEGQRLSETVPPSRSPTSDRSELSPVAEATTAQVLAETPLQGHVPQAQPAPAVPAGTPPNVNPEVGSGPLPSRPAVAAAQAPQPSSFCAARVPRFTLVPQQMPDWPVEPPSLPPHLPKMAMQDGLPQWGASPDQASRRPAVTAARPCPPSPLGVKACDSCLQGPPNRAVSSLEDDLLLRRAYDVYRKQQIDLLHPEL